MQSVDLKITIPQEYILLMRDEYDTLNDQIDERVWIGFDDLLVITDLGRNKLDTILKRYRAELDIYNGGPVKYPDGGKWSFEKEGIKQWLKENHSRIWKDDNHG